MKNAICAIALLVCTSGMISAQSRTPTGSLSRRRSNPIPTPTTPPPATSTPTPTSSLSVAEQIAADMTGHSEGQPAGWPWGTDPTINMGNNPAGNGAAVQWGVIYVASSGSSATNTRVSIRDAKSTGFRKAHKPGFLVRSQMRPRSNYMRVIIPGVLRRSVLVPKLMGPDRQCRSTGTYCTFTRTASPFFQTIWPGGQGSAR